MKELIAKSVFWIVWSRGGTQILSFVTTVMVARLLTPTDYGLVAMAGIWIGTLAMLADLGLAVAVIQYPDLDDSELNVCFWITLTVALSGYTALYLSAPSIAAWFVTPALADVLRIAGLSLLLMTFRMVPDALLRKRLEFDKLSRIEIAAALVGLPVMLFLAWAGFGVWALVVGALTQGVVTNLGTYWYMRWWPGLRFRTGRLKSLLQFSMGALGARVGWATFQQTDSFVLAKVSGDAVLGLYSMAMQIAMLPVTKFSVVINQLAGPVMAGLQENRAAMGAAFLRGLRLVACVTAPLALGLVVVADDLIRVALTEKWLAAVPVLQVLALCSLIRSLEVLVAPILFACYRTTFVFWWTIILLCVMPFVFWYGAAWRGALGVALGWLVVYPILRLWMAREGMAELGIAWKTLWHEVRPILGAAFVMAGAVMLLRLGLPGDTTSERVVRLVLSCLTGMGVYGAGIYWQGGLVLRELREMFGWLMRRHATLEEAK